ncbi:uncharacterized protein LOC122835179 [Gambusia affinis]|uniref:uncharacterized protein LOC122835179 n=1 Tax=Gambusia affinis TaxID=33528 RepID=UPI001CDD66F0|nr:uncharacterized protein LOC122835179 [Gambusia affinis]
METKSKKWRSFRELCTNQFQKICAMKSPDYLKRDFLSDLLWQVIEKVADEPTLPLVRETFENAQGKLLCQIMAETGTLDLDILSGMSEVLSERIFQSIASDSFHLASELHLFAILFYPESYPRIVQEFKHHLENPIPQEPTNTKKFLSSVRTKLKDTLFDAEGLYAEENCLSKDGLKSTYPNGKRLVENDREMGMKHGTDERRKMINLVLWKLIRKASHRSTSNYSEKDIIPVYERLSGVLWEELKDVDFIIFPEMDRKIGSDIFQLLSGNEDVVRDRLFHLMKMNHPIVDYKLVACFKRTLTHPRKVHLPKSYMRRALTSTCKDVSSVMFCRKQVHPGLRSRTNCESKDKGEAPTDEVPCDLVLEDLDSVNPENQNTIESPVSYNRSRGFEHSPKPQNIGITTVECENQTLVESAVSETVCRMYPDLASSMSKCRPIFIQVRPYKPVLEDTEEETPESQQNTKQDATNVNLDLALVDLESVNSEGQNINEDSLYVNEGDLVLEDLESLDSEGQYRHENPKYVNEGDIVLEDLE